MPRRYSARPRRRQHPSSERDFESYSGRRRGPGACSTFSRVSRVWRFMRAYGLDLLIVVAAVAMRARGRAAADDSPDEPDAALWFAVPAIALVVLPLLARRRLPFAAPASVWLLAAALSFIDGRLIPFTASVTLAGLAAAFLLGNLRDDVQARVGLAIVVGGAAIVVYNDPDHAAGDLIFTPLLFAIGWLAGFALRERGERAEAAEVRADQAEREREAAARVAVAEERARIARELHDIVAHAVSVMVLQVGAVRHRLPDADPEDTRGARGRRADRPHRARGDAAAARRDAPRRRRARARAPAGPRQPRRRSSDRSARAGLAGAPARRRRALRAPARRSTSPRTGSSRRASPTRSSMPAPSQADVDRPLRRRRARDRGPRRRRRRGRRATAPATASSASASASRSTAAR